jgi:hypothetical protein
VSGIGARGGETTAVQDTYTVREGGEKENHCEMGREGFKGTLGVTIGHVWL